MAILAQGWPPCLILTTISLQVGYSRMGAQPDLSEALPSEGDSGEIILLGVLTLGIFLGLAIAWVVVRCCAVCGRVREERPLTRDRWEALTHRALKFIRKRRKISLAFSNYRNHKLGHLPDPRRTRRASDSRVEPLFEGPAIRRRNGSD